MTSRVLSEISTHASGVTCIISVVLNLILLAVRDLNYIVFSQFPLNHRREHLWPRKIWETTFGLFDRSLLMIRLILKGLCLLNTLN